MTLYHKNSHITVRAYDTYAAEVGLTQESLKARTTEIDAILRMRWGDPIPASDRIREYKAMGWKRCGRCGVYKPSELFSSYKRKGYEAEYLHTYCKHCRAELDRTKRWSSVVPIDPYPARIR